MMRRATVLVLMLLFGTFGLRSVARNTALSAAKVLPPENYNALARIAACEGAPDPERWHILVYDSRAENGLRDYVVADGQIVARNGVSQFAEEIRAEDVIGTPVRVDSDRAALIARYFAAANRVPVTSLNYELRKDALGRAPVWKITCLDANQVSVGWIVINALDESVIARAGFPKQPKIPDAEGKPIAESQLEPIGEGGFHSPADTTAGREAASGVNRSDSGAVASNDGSDTDADRPEATKRPRRSSSSRSKAKSRQTEIRRAEPIRRTITRPVRIVRGILDF